VKTYAPRPRDVERRWYVIDADGAVLGRLATQVARVLRGKDKPIFAPHADTGDHVVVVNARGVVLTGGKRDTKMYHHHSGYPGGLRSVDYARLLSNRPSLAVERAVRGMLPKNRLGRKMLGKLSVYDGAEHPHAAQRPMPLTLGEIPRWEGLPKHEPPADALAEKAPATRSRTRREGGRDDASESKPRRTRAGSAAAARSSSPARGRAAAAKSPAATKSPAGAEKEPAAARSRKAAAEKPLKESAAGKPAAEKPAKESAAEKPDAEKPAKEPAPAAGATSTGESAAETKAPARTRRKKTEEES